jgi:hypothetical protein
MPEVESVAADLRFVKDALDRKQREVRRTPVAIPILWGLIALAGCCINDFNPRYSWTYWGIVPVIGFLLSWLIGGSAMFKAGEYDRETGVRIGLHWGSIFLAAVPVWLLACAGKIDGQEAGQLLILVSGIVYLLAGVHFDRRWLWPGLVMMVGAGVLTYVTRFGWTALGVMLFVALIVGFSMPPRPRHVG